MRGRKLSIVTVLILVAVTALPYKTGYGTSMHEGISSFSQWNEQGPQTILSAQGEIEYWTCPMHPDVKTGEPGKCPECGMDLIPVMKKPASGTQTAPDNSAEKNGESPDTNTSKEETHEHSAHVKETPPPQKE